MNPDDDGREEEDPDEPITLIPLREVFLAVVVLALFLFLMGVFNDVPLIEFGWQKSTWKVPSRPTY